MNGDLILQSQNDDGMTLTLRTDTLSVAEVIIEAGAMGERVLILRDQAAQLRDALTAWLGDGWIAVASQLPPDKARVLVWARAKAWPPFSGVSDWDAYVAFYVEMPDEGPQFNCAGEDLVAVSHWRPLPTPAPVVNSAETTAAIPLELLRGDDPKDYQ